MCLAAAEHVVKANRFADLGIPAWAAEAVRPVVAGEAAFDLRSL